ncbi:MAG: WecB/TagA/CpsF family glycosyltransferase [Ferruginibacter sp.]
MYKTFDILGYKVFSGHLSEINYSKKILLNTFSPNSYGIAKRDRDFSVALKNSDILLLDGVGIAVGSIILYGRNIRKIAGQDCFDYLMAKTNKNQQKVFFLGSTDATLDKIITRVKREYPETTVSGYSPPFKSAFSAVDNKQMIEFINSFNPDVLFVGMTAPKQEKWAYQNRENINVRVIATIGNVFDWYAGNSKRPAKIWIKLRMEWLIRMFLRPEIFKRNIGNQAIFIKDLLSHITHIKRIKNKND